jgi:hypothetical protein
VKKWIGLSVLGVFVLFISIIVIIASQLTKALEYDIFNIEEVDEELF